MRIRGWAWVVTLGLIVALAAPLSPAEQRAAELVVNGGLEGPFHEMRENIHIPDGWVWNDWGSCSFNFTRQTSSPHSGESCQRMEISLKSGGVALRQQQAITLDSSKTYILTGWFRGEDTGPVQFFMRTSNYQSILGRTFTPTRRWRRVRIEARPDRSESATLYILPLNPTQSAWLEIDDVSLRVKE